jgi:hypothetical protein
MKYLVIYEKSPRAPVLPIFQASALWALSMR